MGKVGFGVLIFIWLSGNSMAQTVPVIKFKQLSKILKSESDTVHVVNFWATWCKPCVHELPEFDSLYRITKGKPVKFIMVNLDDAKELETKVIPFLQKRNHHFPVVLLDYVNYNSWIGKVDKQWEGSIPATLIFNAARKKRAFFDREIQRAQLQFSIESMLP